MLGDTVNKRMVRILLECNLVFVCNKDVSQYQIFNEVAEGIPLWVPAPPGQTATAADSTHPTGMHSCPQILLPKHITSQTGRQTDRNI